MSNYSFDVYLVSTFMDHGNNVDCFGNCYETEDVVVFRRHEDAVEYIKGAASAYGYKLKENGPADCYEIMGDREFINEYDEEITEDIRSSANFDSSYCKSAGWKITEITMYSDKYFDEEES